MRFVPFSLPLLVLSACAQLPVVPILQSGGIDYCNPPLLGGEVAYWDALCTNSIFNITTTGPIADGGDIGTWSNIIGYTAYFWTNNSPIGTTGPSYHATGFGTNGTQPYVHFTSSGGFAEHLNPLGSPTNVANPFTILIVLRSDDNFGATIRGVLSDTAELGKPFVFMNTTGFGNYQMSDTTTLTGPISIGTNTLVLTCIFDGADSFMRTNGVAYVAGNTGSSGCVNMRIGSLGNGGFITNHKVSRVELWNRRLTTNEMVTVEGYARRDYQF